jgi:hypothetical protein
MTKDQRMMPKLIPRQKIISKTMEAIVYRNVLRPFVDKIFKEKEERIIAPDGSPIYKHSPEKRQMLDIKARNMWRTIISESNKL